MPSLVVKAWCDGQAYFLSRRPIALHFSFGLIYLSAYLNDKLHNLLKRAVARRPDDIVHDCYCGLVSFITGGDCLSSLQHSFQIVFCNGFVKVPSVSTGESAELIETDGKSGWYCPEPSFACSDVHKVMSTGFVFFAWKAEQQSQEIWFGFVSKEPLFVVFWMWVKQNYLFQCYFLFCQTVEMFIIHSCENKFYLCKTGYY